LPVLAGLRSAAAFLPRAWAGAWGALLLAFAVLAAPAFTDLIAHEHLRWIRAAWALAAVAAWLMVEGALFRIGVSRTAEAAQRLGLGIGGLQFGATELRLFAGTGLVGGFLAVVLGAVAVAFAFLLSAEDAGLPGLDELLRAVEAGEGWAWGIAGLGLLAAWTMVSLMVRLSLFKPATVARGAVVSLDAMSVTQGAFWPLLAGILVTAAPPALLTGWERGFIASGFVMPIPSTVYALVRAAFLVALALPFAFGFLSYAYDRLEYRPRG
jgi:hypothetical protein